MIPYDENGFEQAVRTVLAPWLRDHVTGGTFTGFDGARIQYYKAEHPDAKAAVVMVHGFCEFFGKFHETAYDFHENGYSVYFLEQRGHGGSQRSVDEPDVVDVADFSDYVEDLKCFLDQVVLPQTSGQRLILYAHSMGGCVGALFLERYPEYFYAAVLSSPMLRMSFRGNEEWKMKALAGASRLPVLGGKLLPGMKRFDPDTPDFDGSGTSSRARFDYQFSIRKDPSTQGIYSMNAGTFRWGRAALKATIQVMKHADRIRIPLLICQAGKDLYVDNEGQNEVARRAKHVKLVRFPQAKHEIYAADPDTLEKYYREVLKFFRKASTR